VGYACIIGISVCLVLYLYLHWMQRCVQSFVGMLGKEFNGQIDIWFPPFARFTFSGSKNGLSHRPGPSGPPPGWPPVADRECLVRTMCRLSPCDLATLVTMIEGAAIHVSRHGTVAEQVAELICWAESSNGCGLPTIEKALASFR